MIKNYTPHTVTINGKDYPSEGIARCTSEIKIVDNLEGIDITETTFGEVFGLPETEEGTFYIVSRIVAEAVKGKREDCFIVSETIRDEEGRIIGCKSLGRI